MKRIVSVKGRGRRREDVGGVDKADAKEEEGGGHADVSMALS